MMTNQSVSGEGTTNQSVVPLVPGTTSTPQTPQTNQPTQTGAFMLFVCCGYLFDVILFIYDLFLLVVLVGFPFSTPESPDLKARIAFFFYTFPRKHSLITSLISEFF